MAANSEVILKLSPLECGGLSTHKIKYTHSEHGPLLGLSPLSLQPHVVAVQAAAQRGEGTCLRPHSQAQSPVSDSRTQAEAAWCPTAGAYQAREPRAGNNAHFLVSKHSFKSFSCLKSSKVIHEFSSGLTDSFHCWSLRSQPPCPFPPLRPTGSQRVCPP